MKNTILTVISALMLLFFASAIIYAAIHIGTTTLIISCVGFVAFFSYVFYEAYHSPVEENNEYSGDVYSDDEYYIEEDVNKTSESNTYSGNVNNVTTEDNGTNN